MSMVSAFVWDRTLAQHFALLRSVRGTGCRHYLNRTTHLRCATIQPFSSSRGSYNGHHTSTNTNTNKHCDITSFVGRQKDHNRHWCCSRILLENNRGKSRVYSTAAASQSYEQNIQPSAAASLTNNLESGTPSVIPTDAPIQLSNEQRFLLQKIIKDKKSVFFTGSAGTGKSVLLRQLIKDLKEVYKPGQVAVTASTGIAACNIGGCTLHSFAGIGVGTGNVEQLMMKMEEKKGSRGRWRRTKVLIIDEISMIDGELFDKLEEIARRVKKNQKPFGGIQLIITGDFFQLPPVIAGTNPLQDPSSPSPPMPMYISPTRASLSGGRSTTTIVKQDSATPHDEVDEVPHFESEYDTLLPPVDTSAAIASDAQQTMPTLCFDAKSWKTCIEYTLQLTEVFRQRDQKFIDMLTEMRHGKLSEETCRIFKELEREPQYPNDGIRATELFALRKEVDSANHRHLAQLPGPVYMYQPRDDGPWKEVMDRVCMAPTLLQLKENAQVMLIKNLTPTLVNGSMGIVVGFHKDHTIDSETGEWVTSHFPVVRFVGEEDDLVIRPEEWRLELPDGEVLGSRIQVPLILAWAMSIHKSQGQTMERLKVDMGKIFEAGQAYVAVSRATSLEGLQVLNFNKRSVLTHDRVAEFYDNLMTVQQMIEHERELKPLKGRRKRKTKTSMDAIDISALAAQQVPGKEKELKSVLSAGHKEENSESLLEESSSSSPLSTSSVLSAPVSLAAPPPPLASKPLSKQQSSSRTSHTPGPPAWAMPSSEKRVPRPQERAAISEWSPRSTSVKSRAKSVSAASSKPSSSLPSKALPEWLSSLSTASQSSTEKIMAVSQEPSVAAAMQAAELGPMPSRSESLEQSSTGSSAGLIVVGATKALSARAQPRWLKPASYSSSRSTTEIIRLASTEHSSAQSEVSHATGTDQKPFNSNTLMRSTPGPSTTPATSAATGAAATATQMEEAALSPIISAMQKAGPKRFKPKKFVRSVPGASTRATRTTAETAAVTAKKSTAAERASSPPSSPAHSTAHKTSSWTRYPRQQSTGSTEQQFRQGRQKTVVIVPAGSNR